MNLKLAFSPCPNDTFIFDAIVNHRIDTKGYSFEVILADVEELNKNALNNSVHISKLSYSAMAYLTQNYQILNAGSALGKGCGPLLITTSDKIDKPLSDFKVAIPGKYTTAALLMKLAFPEVTNTHELIFSEIEDAVLRHDFDAGLIIHENRFTYQQKGLKLIKDLGAFWEEFSGASIPLGGIAIQRTLPEQVKKDVDELIKNSVAYAFKHPEQSLPYTKMHAQAMDEKVIQQHINLYVNNYSLHLGEQGKNAIQLLFDTAREINAIPAITEPLFVSE